VKFTCDKLPYNVRKVTGTISLMSADGTLVIVKRWPFIKLVVMRTLKPAFWGLSIFLVPIIVGLAASWIL
jgi:hypothetical protein